MLRRRKSSTGARFELGHDDDDSPYGGKVVLAKRKKPEDWPAVAIQVTSVLFAFWLLYVSYFHMATVQFYVTRFYAHLGHDHAQHLVGQKYLRGYGVDVDEDRAAYWFQKAAEQGHPHASYDWAIARLRGSPDHVEKTEAHRRMRYAAEHGVPEAERFLESIGAPRDGDSASA